LANKKTHIKCSLYFIAVFMVKLSFIGLFLLVQWIKLAVANKE